MWVQMNPIPYVSTHVSSWISLLSVQVTAITYLQVIFSWGNDESNRVMSECPLGIEITVGSPRSLSSPGSESWGMGFDQYSLLTFGCSDLHGPQP